ncbi:hypothetical protein PHYSODRAFT_342476 [Phytophthora sojae]|uniref:LYC1 C-terminal domain-containing protein n=1 Tax=Phytophthora sojae (strain P6497) TaxID=1094619 RepID=G5AGP3_PHYSP|nr:hypothetical protein PHYSODRAFT_342476 [Phytophthora sojae]EGZ05323.1 hypothetical protein PHYSODRAFT_342476 [Phytophthora sojae]|eukprot:XP_009539244.1 hypothetical protein PHYSODRAFT_342476 [Phytophthora sojae]
MDSNQEPTIFDSTALVNELIARAEQTPAYNSKQTGMRRPMFRVVQLTQEALKQWQKKGEAQRATRFSQDGALFWALVDKTEENPQTSSDSGVVADPSVPLRLPSKLGEIERGFSYQISSVYTLPEFRKRGLAGFFLTEVAKQLEQLPQALISVLYSDVGPTFYDKLGWKCHPSKLATLEIDHPRNTKAVDNNNSSTELKSLVLDDKLDKFLEADNARLVDALANSEKFQGRNAFLILPTRDSIEWQFVNGVHYARAAGFDELPSRCGVRINDDAFVLWWHNLKESTLYVDRVRFPDSGDNAAEIIRVLLDAAMQEGRKLKLKKVVIWDPPSGLLRDDVRSLVEIEVAERKLSLSNAMVFRRGNVDDSKTTALPHWFCNEKYAWV